MDLKLRQVLDAASLISKADVRLYPISIRNMSSLVLYQMLASGSVIIVLSKR